MEGIRNVVEVLCVEAGDGNTTVHCHVDGVVLAELVNHVFVQSSECEHADLIGDVAPIVLISHLFELAAETNAHVLHTA